MIRIEPVPFIPILPFSDGILEGFTSDAWNCLKSSEEIYVAWAEDTPLFCIGVYRATYLSKPYLWLLACEGLSWRHLRELRELFNELAPAALWALVKDEARVKGFAKFFGLQPVRAANDYLMMER